MRGRTGLAALLGLLLMAAPVMAQPGCPAIPPRNPMPQEATPAPGNFPEWRARVAEIDAALARTNRSQVDLVFLGDSITQGWEPTMFAQFFGHRRALNLGVLGDGTQGLLWRLRAGQWGDLRPAVAVLLIGTNNTATGARPEDTALGIAEVIRLIHGRSRQTRILLLGLLPRGADMRDPLRQTNMRVNELVARCADGDSTIYLDIGHLFVRADGRLSPTVAFDQLHLTMVGYAILGAAIAPTVRAILGP